MKVQFFVSFLSDSNTVALMGTDGNINLLALSRREPATAFREAWRISLQLIFDEIGKKKTQKNKRPD